MKTKRLIMIGVILVILAGCSTIPKWWRQESKDSNYIYLYGEATKTNKVASFESAKAMAYNDAAQYVENYLKSLTEDWLQETGTDDPYIGQSLERIIKMVSEQKFSHGMVVMEDFHEKDGKYTTYVRLKLPSASINGSLIDRIRSEKSRYDEWKKIEAFKKLEAETMHNDYQKP